MSAFRALKKISFEIVENIFFFNFNLLAFIFTFRENLVCKFN